MFHNPPVSQYNPSHLIKYSKTHPNKLIHIQKPALYITSHKNTSQMAQDQQPPKNNQPNQQDAQNQQNKQIDPQQYDTFLYKFQQQIIDAWKPVPHTSSNIILYLILSIICIGLGIALIVTAVSTQEIQFRYDNLPSCPFGSTACTTTFTLTEKLQSPVYLYYGMTNFYQNHRRYIKFFSSQQLNNGQQSTSDAELNCGSFVNNGQLGYLTNSFGNATLPAGSVGFPCGTSGRIYNMFRPQLKSFTVTFPNGSAVPITKNGVAWSSDIGRHKNWDLNQQPFSVEEQDWLVWYRPAARQNFFKLFGIVNSPMPAGTYNFGFQNTFNASFGQKSIFLGKANYVGNRDLFLGIAFLVLGGGCLLLLIVFIAKWIAEKRDKQHIN